MSDYISRVQAIEEINKYRMTSGVTNQGTWNECVDVIAHTVSELPSADVRENVTGEWIYDKAIENWRCSKCNETPKTLGYVGTDDFMREHFKFCNHCGADMRGEKHE